MRRISTYLKARLRAAIPVLALALAACTALPAAAQAGCGGVQTARPAHRPGAPLAVGDSTMLLALPSLARAGFAINAHGCRQFPEALALLRQLRDAHQLPGMIVIALGADGVVTRQNIRAALGILGPGRKLVLVTPIELGGGSGQDAVTVRDAGTRADGRISVLDWVTHSRGHPGWFQPDGVHLTFVGAAAFAKFLRGALLLAPLPPPFGGALSIRDQQGHRARVPFSLRMVLPRGWKVTRRSERHHLPQLSLHAGGACPARVQISASGYYAPKPSALARLRELEPASTRVLMSGAKPAAGTRWAAWTTTGPRQVGGAWTRALGDPLRRGGSGAQRAFLDVRASALPLRSGGAGCTRSLVFRLLRSLR